MSRLRRILWCIQDRAPSWLVPVIGVMFVASFWAYFFGVIFYGVTRNG